MNKVENTESGIAKAFRMPEASTLSVRAISRASLSVTEIKLSRDGFGWTDPIPATDAAMLAVQLRAIPFHEAMTEGRAVPVYDVRPGDTLFYDMRRDPRANVTTQSHSLHFVFTRQLLNEIADAVESEPIEALLPQTGAAVRDLRLARLARAVLPALRNPDSATNLYTSHLSLALGLYACWRYGNMHSPEQPCGELGGVQVRLATEYMAGRLDGRIELNELAAVCGMPVRRFLRAFRESTGMAPYQWLSMRRLDFARSLLRLPKREVKEIAGLAGFSDEDNFIEVFTRSTGMSPFDWRATLQ